LAPKSAIASPVTKQALGSLSTLVVYHKVSIRRILTTNIERAAYDINERVLVKWNWRAMKRDNVNIGIRTEFDRCRCHTRTCAGIGTSSGTVQHRTSVLHQLQYTDALRGRFLPRMQLCKCEPTSHGKHHPIGNLGKLRERKESALTSLRVTSSDGLEEWGREPRCSRYVIRFWGRLPRSARVGRHGST
jgi:hypothetical protein